MKYWTVGYGFVIGCFATHISRIFFTTPRAPQHCTRQDPYESVQIWNWHKLATDFLAPFPSISQQSIQSALKACFDNGTMYCARIQVIDGRLYINDYRAIFFDRQYAPSRVLPVLNALLEFSISDVDIVVAAVDEPRIKTVATPRFWKKTAQNYNGNDEANVPPSSIFIHHQQGAFGSSLARLFVLFTYQKTQDSYRSLAYSATQNAQGRNFHRLE